MKQVVFFLLLLVVAATVALAISNQQLILDNLALLTAVAIVMFAFWRWDYLLLLHDYERAVIFRFGRVNRVGGPGWAIIFAPIEDYTKVDLRAMTLDVPKQDVITKDNIQLKVDAVIYIRVKKDNQSVINSVVEVEDFKKATVLYVIARLRDVIGSMNFEEVIYQIEVLNVQLKEGLKEISKEWGIECESVELQDIDVPDSVMDSMHKRQVAIQERLVRVEQANAHMAEINAVREAAENLSDKALAYYYIKALEELGRGKSTKFVFPMEISKLASLVSSKLSSGSGPESSAELEELFRKYAPAIKAFVESQKEGKNKTKIKGK